MNILIIGSGGREHAITWKICQSPKAGKVFVLPGNPGTSQIATNVEGVSVDDHVSIVAFCKANHIDLVIVGPEDPLALGLADRLQAAGIRVFGPAPRSMDTRWKAHRACASRKTIAHEWPNRESPRLRRAGTPPIRRAGPKFEAHVSWQLQDPVVAAFRPALFL